MSRTGDLCFGKEDSTVASLPLLCGRREERRWNFKSLAFLFPPSKNEYWLWLEATAPPPGGGGQINFPSESYSFHATTNSLFYFAFCLARNERPGKLDYASDARVQLVQSAVVASFSPYTHVSPAETGNYKMEIAHAHVAFEYFLHFIMRYGQFHKSFLDRASEISTHRRIDRDSAN